MQWTERKGFPFYRCITHRSGPAAKPPAAAHVVAAVRGCCEGSVDDVVAVVEPCVLEGGTHRHELRQHAARHVHTAREVQVPQSGEGAVTEQSTVNNMGQLLMLAMDHYRSIFIMAHLHRRRRTLVRTWIPIPSL